MFELTTVFHPIHAVQNHFTGEVPPEVRYDVIEWPTVEPPITDPPTSGPPLYNGHWL